ncbi:periplasmic type I secretion system protein [Neisseria meningitidis]|nr:periplasmic type I secretion system protein [Neisseria meningitidis]
MQIVPVDDKLLVEAYIRPQDIAFIRTGQPALVKVSAYDYSIYGGLEGKVTLVGADTVSNSMQNRANDLKLDPNQVYYRVLVQTENNSLKDKNGKPMPIIPGMVATVDIKTGEKNHLPIPDQTDYAYETSVERTLIDKTIKGRLKVFRRPLVYVLNACLSGK